MKRVHFRRWKEAPIGKGKNTRVKEKRAVIGEKGTDQKGKGPLIRKRKERGTYKNKNNTYQ